MSLANSLFDLHIRYRILTSMPGNRATIRTTMVNASAAGKT